MTKEAIILAGGFGTRLKSVVNDVPKPMAPVCGRPFLAFLLEHLNRFEFTHVILSVGYKYEVIQSYFGHRYKQIDLSYSIEDDPLGTGGGIRMASESMRSDTVLVLNGDTFFDVDLNSFQTFHLNGGFELSVGLRKVDDVSRYGAVQLNTNRISGFLEKGGTSGNGLINGGVYCIGKNLIMQIPSNRKVSFETEILQSRYRELGFGGFVSEGYFIDIGIPEDYRRANVEFRELFNRR